MLALMLLLIITNKSIAAGHQHHGAATVAQSTPSQLSACQSISVLCAKTVTSAFAPNGDLWRVWVQQQQMYLQRSGDNGLTFSKATAVDIAKEPISARNENRPKIGFDDHQGVYLSWAVAGKKKYTGDIRFSYSADYGKHFTTPITVNDDQLPTGHSFNEMLVTKAGEVSIVWLDGRLKYQLRQQGKKGNGSALYLGQANMRQGDTHFVNQQLANNTCVCCRIAISHNAQGQLALLWRHIYGDNIREFALLTLPSTSTLVSSKQTLQPQQVSYDHWQIDGCPHQGGGLSIDQHNNYHMVWFNMGDKGKGIFYAHSNDQGKTLSTPLALGDFSAQAAHPHVQHNGDSVDIVWSQFNGNHHQLMHQQSVNKGQTFTEARVIAQSTNGADRPFIIRNAGVNYVSWQRPKQGHVFTAL